MNFIVAFQADRLISQIQDADPASPAARKAFEKLGKLGTGAVPRILEALASADRRQTAEYVEVLKSLSEWVGIHRVALEQVLWQSLDAGMIGCGKIQTQKAIWQVPGQRICPRCFAEQGFIDLRWQWFALIVCPSHRRFLIDRCVCGRFLHWDRKELGQCDCGKSLASLRTREASEAQAALAQELFAAITDAMKLRARKENFHRWSAEIELFLRVQAFMQGREGPLRIQDRGVNELKRPLRRLLQILHSSQGWTALWQAFTHYQRTETGKYGYPAELRPVVHLLKSYPDATQASASFEHYIGNIWFGRQLNEPHRTRWWTKEAVIAYLKRDRDWVSRWIEKGRLKTYRLHDQTPVYRRDDVLALKERLDRSLSFSDVAERLRLSDHVLLDLLRHNLISAWSRPDVDQVRDWRIDPEDLEQFLQRLRAASTSDLSPPTVPWDDALKMLQWRGFSSAALVEKMLNGEVTFRFGRILSRTGFCSGSLSRLYKVSPRGKLLVEGQVNRLLKLGYRGAEVLVDRGLLSRRHVEVAEYKPYRMYFDEQEVQAFAKEHWRLADIAQWSGCRKHGLGQKLRTLGIEPVVPQQALDGVYLFRKADVLTLKPGQLQALDLPDKRSRLLKTSEVADRLSLSVPTVIAYTRRGLLRPHLGKGAQPGKGPRYTEHELKLFQQRFAGEERLWDALEVAEYLGCDRSTVLKQWMAQGYLMATKQVEGIGYLFRSRSVRRLKQYLANTLTGPELAEQLGVHRNRVFKWMQAGIITPTPYPGATEPKIYRYHRNLLPVLVQRLGTRSD